MLRKHAMACWGGLASSWVYDKANVDLSVGSVGGLDAGRPKEEDLSLNSRKPHLHRCFQQRGGVGRWLRQVWKRLNEHCVIPSIVRSIWRPHQPSIPAVSDTDTKRLGIAVTEHWQRQGETSSAWQLPSFPVTANHAHAVEIHAQWRMLLMQQIGGTGKSTMHFGHCSWSQEGK